MKSGPQNKKKERQFEAQQTWKVSVAAADAQKIIDAAVRAGANYVLDVDWDVADETALQAKAGEKALDKARKIAQQMAAGLGAKAGVLVYASNRVPAPTYSETVTVNASPIAPPAPPPPPHFTLFPKKVKADATVYAVFALE